MNALATLLNSAALGWWEAILRASWQGGLALALVGLVIRLRPRLQPRLQCWLWRGAYLKLLLAFVWGTPLTLAVLPAPPLPAIPAPPQAVAPPARASLPPGSLPSVQRATEAPPAPPTASLTLTGGLFLLWLGLVVRQSGRFLAEWRRARRISRRCRPIHAPELLSACARLSQQLGVRRPPRLMRWEGTHTPLLLGVCAPAIVLSEKMLTTYSAMEQRLMLAHELAHLKRRDLLWAWLPLLARALFAFHPLVWLAQPHLITAQEMACDAIALELTQAPTSAYGELLIRIAAHPDPASRSGLPILGMATSLSYPTLKRRLLAMKTFPVLSPARLALSGSVLSLLGLASLVPWRVAAQTPPLPSGLSRTPAQAAGRRNGALQAHVGNYTLQLESADTIPADAAEVVFNGARFQPNVAVRIRVQGERPDAHFIAGLFPAAIGIDARGVQAEASPLPAPQTFLHAPADNFGQILLRLPDPGVPRLRSLEGTLLVFGSAETKLELAAADFKPGAQKRIGNITLRVNAVRTEAGTLTLDLILTRPRPHFAPAVPGPDQPLLAAVDSDAAQDVRAELRDDRGQFYRPSEFGSSLTTVRQAAPVPGDAGTPNFERAPYRQSLQIKFPLPKRGAAPKTLSLFVDSYAGKYERLPFKFADIPLSAAR